MRSTQVRVFSVVVGVSLLMSACGDSGERVGESLEDRVLARWSYMASGDFGAAWEMATPGFRQINSQEDYEREMSRRQVRWSDPEVLEITCPESELCEVRVRIVYQTLGGSAELRGMRVPRVLEERWVYVDGDWWFVQS